MMGGKFWLIAAAALVVCAMVPFFRRFERGDLPARRVVLVAVMTALAAASRVVFFMVPGFKPILGFVIIGGLGLGADAGFMIGSMSALLSNFLFGQGPWTPFQMFAWGMIGFLAGVLAPRLIRSDRRTGEVHFVPLLLYGAASCYLLHGVVTDLWTILSVTETPNLASVMTIFAAAVPFDTALAAATCVTLALFAKPMLRKLERVKVKYGL